jgi:putative tricarboxylic transport membrane protein
MSVEEASEQPSWTGRLALAGILLAAGIFALSQVASIRSKAGWEPSGARFMPLVVCGAWVVLAAINLVQVLRAERTRGRSDLRPAMLLMADLVGYAFLVIPLGYIIATAIAFLVGARILGSRRWVRDVLVAVPLAVGVYFGFTELLSIRLPAGIL